MTPAKQLFVGGMLSLFAVFSLGSCSSTTDGFNARSQYPPDPWVKGYANPEDCLGGETLAARHIPLPEYPKKALKRGNQGWVIVKLDVTADGTVTNVEEERSIPSGVFTRHTLNIVKTWRFAPTQNEGLQNCRILIRYRLGIVSLA